MDTNWNTATSLNYPGQLYAGFSTNIIGSISEKKLDFVLSNERDPQFKCPKVSLRFRQIEERRFFKKKLVWVADVTLTNCHSIYSDSEEFVGVVKIFTSSYETAICIYPKYKSNRLYNLHNKWNMKIQFQHSHKEIGDIIVKCISERFNVLVEQKIKK